MHSSHHGFDSEAVLQAVQRHRTRLPALQGVNTSQNKPTSLSYPSDLNRSKRKAEAERQEEERKIWEKLNSRAYLPYELRNQFGGQAQQLAVQNYGGSTDPTDYRQPKLIDRILLNRNRDFSDKQQTNLLHLQHLDNERSKLLVERQALREKRREVMVPPSPTLTVSRHRAQVLTSPWSSSPAPSLHSVHGVDSFVNFTKSTLPAQTAKYQRLRKNIHDDFKKLHKPYKGELGPQSYQPWQMSDYYMVRGLVEELVDNFLDWNFRNYPQGIDNQTAQAIAEANSREWDTRHQQLSETRAVQLLMEELVLEVTGELSQSIGNEFRQLYSYIRNHTDSNFMNMVEMVAQDTDSGRHEEDLGYQLVAKTLFNLQKDRSRHRPNTCRHTQHLHILGPEQEEEEPPDADTELITFHNVTPMDLRTYDPRVTDSEEEKKIKEMYLNYRKREAEHWQKMMTSITTISVSSKCQGIKSAALSPDHRLLALGTNHGDIMVYDSQTQPWRPLAAIHNQSKGNDQVIDLSWSPDGLYLVSSTQTGTFSVWGINSGKVLDKVELKGLELKLDKANNTPQQLSLKLRLDVENGDFRFHTGALAEAEVVDPSRVPTCGAIIPADRDPIEPEERQNALFIALDSGDVLKCDIGQQRPPQTAPNEAAEVKEPNTIGHNLNTDLLHHHKYKIILLGYIHNSYNIVTVDQKGYINIWALTREDLTSLEWYEPRKKYKLDMSNMMYRPSPSARPNIIFTDQTKADKRRKTRQEINLERMQVQARIDDLKLPDPWHVEYIQEQNLLTEIYRPDTEAITETGTLFHVLLKRFDTQQLSTYFTRVYTPFKVRSTKLLGCCQTPSRCEIVFLLLFPAYPPKESHMSIVILDLHTMTVRDHRRDIVITDDKYQKYLQEDVVSCHVSKVFGPTGSSYLFVNISGMVSAYSLNTGIKVLRTETEKKPTDAFVGSSIKFKSLTISPYTRLLVSGTQGKYYAVLYATDQKQKKLQNQVVILEIKDENAPEDKQQTWQTFLNWGLHPKVPPLEHRLDPQGWAPGGGPPAEGEDQGASQDVDAAHILNCFKEVRDTTPPVGTARTPEAAAVPTPLPNSQGSRPPTTHTAANTPPSAAPPAGQEGTPPPQPPPQN